MARSRGVPYPAWMPKPLWAPWRLAYVEHADELDRCIFCEPEEDLVVAHAQAYGIEPTHDEGLWSRSRDFDWGD